MVAVITRRVLFLSTPSARRATRIFFRVSSSIFISIHALREEGDGDMEAIAETAAISIHALREEGDLQNIMLRAEQI